MSELRAKKLVEKGASITVEADSLTLASHQTIKIGYIFNRSLKDPRPFLVVRIFGKEITALLDSGASNTILGSEAKWVLEKFPAKVKNCHPTHLETADMTKHCIDGQIVVPITLEGRTRDISVLVVPTLKQGLILGIDFWDRMQLITDMHNKTWEFSPNVGCLGITEGIKSKEFLSTEEAQQLQKLVEEYSRDQVEERLGRTNLVKHIVDTGDASPIKQRYYPLSPARQRLVNEELDKMLKMGVVVPSKSAWSSPVLLLDKPDGSKRFIVDFRKVNQVTKRDAYPLPRVTSILDRLRDATYLSSLDIKSAYWQVPLEEASQEKTAFTIPGRGLFMFTSMPFGLHNAPATWQRLIDNILGPELEPNVFVYLDDIIVVTPTFNQHLKILEEIFKRLKEANLTLNKEKCKFCRPELKYLGYVVDRDGLRVDPGKVEAIIGIPTPTNQKQVRQFCGTASWYRRFIPNFATRMHPLNLLLRKKQKFVWTEEAQTAFEDIRSCLIKAPILSCPDFDKPFIVSCDASGIGLGAVLSQETPSGEVVIAYASRSLTNAEQKFSATERECLAVIWAIERFRAYIEGTKFQVVTDHYSLLWLHNLKEPQGRLARWALRLQPFDFTISHRKGKENVVPDLLSRTPNEEIETPKVSDLHFPPDIADRWYMKMVTNVKEHSTDYPSWRVTDDKLWKYIPCSDRVDDDILTWKIVVPKELRKSILYENHDAPTAGHLGVFKTYQRLKRYYYWPKMRMDIATYVKHCKTCQSIKTDPAKPTGLMGERRGVDTPWRMIAADLMGPFPRSLSGQKYLLVVTDTFTKYVVLRPLRAATAKNVARHLEEDVFLIYGVPEYIICDNGSEFAGSAVRELASGYKVKMLYNARHHPQANPTERVNKTILSMIRAYVGENHRTWDKHIAQLGYALRTATHESTGYSPAFLVFGRELPSAGRGNQFHQGEEIPSVAPCENYGKKLEDLKVIHQEVTQKLKEAHQTTTHRYNLRRRPAEEFKVNELVWKRNFAQSDATKHFSAKLTPRFVGPFTVVKKISPLVYELKNSQGKNAGNWHVSDLKRYIV